MEKPDEAAEQLFKGALELSPHERQVFLDRAACHWRKLARARLTEGRTTG